MTLGSFIRRLRAARAGVATIEFAMWMALIFMSLLAAFDIGTFVIERGRMSQALSGVSIAAFKNRDEVNYAAIPAYVRGASNLRNAADMTITVRCNGAATCANESRVCACLTKNATFVAAGSCGQACSGASTPNSVSGYYMQVVASQPFDPLFVPAGTLGQARIEQTATVRLQ